MTMNTIITVLFYAVAICHCLTSKLIAPFLKAIFAELTEPMLVSTDVLPALPVAVTDVATPVAAPATPRPARRRRSTAKAAA